MIACVKTMVGEDAWITIQEIAEAFYQGVYQTLWKTNSATAGSQLVCSLTFWHKKTTGIGLHTHYLLSFILLTFVTQDIYIHDVVTADKTWLHHYEPERKAKHRTDCRCPEETHRKWQEEFYLRRRCCIQHSSTSMESCCKSRAKKGRVSLGNTAQSVLSEVNPFYKRVPPNIELHGITILHDSNTPAHKSKSSARVLAWPFLSHDPCALWPALARTPPETSGWAKISPHHPSQQLFYTVFHVGT